MNLKPFNIDEHIEHLISIVVEYTPKIIGALLVLIIGLWMITRLSRLATKSMERRELDISLRTFLRSLISIGLKVILIVTVAGMIGIGTTSFVTILGAAGLAIGLALQGSLSNFAGGVLTLIFKPFKVGDAIEVLGQSGIVKEIQIFNTILLTSDLKTIILPNGAVSNGTIINYSKNGILRGDVQIAISVENNVDVVKNLLMEDLLKHTYILKNPAPEVAAIKIADGGITLSIKAYCLVDHYSIINSEVVAIAQAVFTKNNVIPPPLRK
jgi:small conductance mechanosensitive channel